MKKLLTAGVALLSVATLAAVLVKLLQNHQARIQKLLLAK